MKVIAAFLLAKLGGNKNPTTSDLKKIFDSVGAEFDETKVDLLFSLVKDHDVTELIAAGREKMASAALSSGSGSVAMVAGGGNATSGAEPEAEAKKKVEEEKEESSDGEGMMSLFD